jgi:NAD-dependent deacetylase
MQGKRKGKLVPSHYTSPTDHLSRARALVAGDGRIVVLTGAGISTDSGIPDFRGPQGVWTKDPASQRNSNITDYMASADIRRRVWQGRLASPAWTATPNPGHVAIVELERQGRLHALVTQNIDGLHQLAGNDPTMVVELHGTMREVMCLDCGDRGPMEPVLDRLRAGEDDPHCRRCAGLLKSATISFGQSLVVEDLMRAHRAALECDLLLAVGSSLTVSPACDLVAVAAGAGAEVVIVNAQPTPYDAIAGAVVAAPISEVLPRLVER